MDNLPAGDGVSAAELLYLEFLYGVLPVFRILDPVPVVSRWPNAVLLSFSLLVPLALDSRREQLVGTERRLPQYGEVLSFGVVAEHRGGSVKEARRSRDCDPQRWSRGRANKGPREVQQLAEY